MAIAEDLITVAEAAKILNRSIEQVRRYLREGKLPGQRIGQQWFIPRGALDSLGRKAPEKSVYQRRIELLEEIRELRERINRESGTLPSGAQLVEESREARMRELVDNLH